MNLASRLEGANKAFGTRILVDGETLRQAGDAVRSLPIGPVVVVGRTTPTELHAVVDDEMPQAAIDAAVALQRAIAEDDRAAAARALEQIGEHRQLDALGLRWAEVIDGDGALVLTLESK